MATLLREYLKMKRYFYRGYLSTERPILLGSVMGTHSFIHYFVTVTVTSLVTAITNEFLFSPAYNEVKEAIGDLKIDNNVTVSFWRT
jgi:hypothetical protein